MEWVYLVLGGIFLFTLFFGIYSTVKKNRIKKQIYNQGFVHYKNFENQWITSRGCGLKYSDGPGCYVILIFDKPVVNDNFKGFENVYVGQSVNRYQRVHNHFNGKGNGDVYADIKYGKSVYVQLIPCKKEMMNAKEKELIALFNATQSYNKTKGGATHRRKGE